MDLFTPIDRLPRTATVTIQKMTSLGIETFWDLLNYFPTRYVDYSHIVSIENIVNDTRLTVCGTVASAKNQYTRRRFTIQKITVTDETGSLTCTWFNQPYLITLVKPGMTLCLSGTTKYDRGEISLYPEEYEIMKPDQKKTVHTGRLVPIYPEAHGLSSRVIREKMAIILEAMTRESLEKIFPESFERSNHLIDQFEAYQQIHFPDSLEKAQTARTRLAFDELFIVSLSSQLVKRQWQHEKVTTTLEFTPYQKKLDRFIASLPFELTNAQKRSIQEILADLKKSVPMNRLLQGDVGSGKTVVAAIACYLAYLNNAKSLLMAPTEILAQQHFATLSKLFPADLNIVLITGSKKATKAELEKADIIVGTHALISQKIAFDSVALTIIDEQHKFGVAQRGKLRDKGFNPHLLTMTATPIPRTVSLTLYGELDVSVIDEMPVGRIMIKTYLTPLHKRNDAYEWIKKKIREENEQVFIVCPLIEESEVETIKTVKAATAEFDTLKQNVFKGINLGLLHGKMKSKEKDEIMSQFTSGECQILVSTPVVEVGVDIPNANIIIIEAAERFGLAQLHQLRGRVGRSNRQAYCLLFTEKKDPITISRLQKFSRINNGFELAEYDLTRRGVGEMYGTRQHGASELKIATFTDIGLIRSAHNAAVSFIDHHALSDFPQLDRRLKTYQKHRIARD